MTDITTTVVMTVYQGAHQIARALRSIEAQNRPVDTVIVVDDGSTDELDQALAAAGFGGTLVRQENRGQGSALNTGIRLVTTSHVLFLDQDDEWPSDRLEWQCQAMTEQPCDVVLGGVVNVTTVNGHVASQQNMGPARVMGAGLFDRRVFEIVGLLPEDRRIHEVFDWWSRAAGLLQVHKDERIALTRHIHGGNMTLQPEHRSGHDLIHRLRDHMNRRRETGFDATP